MWKKTRLIVLLLSNPLSSRLLSSSFIQVPAQKMQTFKERCGAFYESMAHLYIIKQAEPGFYQFHPGQTVASIGAQCCHIEAAFAATTDSIRFYLEDIDPSKLKREQTGFRLELLCRASR